jgi:hypothetical protein
VLRLDELEQLHRVFLNQQSIRPQRKKRAVVVPKKEPSGVFNTGRHPSNSIVLLPVGQGQ